MVQLTVEYPFCARWSYTQPLTDNCFPTRYIFNHLELIFRFTWNPTFWISVQIWFFGTWYALLVFIFGFLDGCYLIFHLFSVFVLIFQNCGKNTVNCLPPKKVLGTQGQIQKSIEFTVLPWPSYQQALPTENSLVVSDLSISEYTAVHVITF